MAEALVISNSIRQQNSGYGYKMPLKVLSSLLQRQKMTWENVYKVSLNKKEGVLKNLQ